MSPDPASDKADPTDKKTWKQRGHGPRPQPALPVIDVLHLFEQADLVCPHCGKPMRVIDGHEQVRFLHLYGGLASTSKALLAPMKPLPIRSGMCWSHARRLFLPYEDPFPREVGTLLRLIRRLIVIDDEADKPCRQRAGPDGAPEVIL